MSDWFCKLGGAPAGPFTRDELDYLRDRGQLTGETEVRLEEQRTWSRAADVLSDLFPQQAASAQVAAAVAEPAQPAVEPVPTEAAAAEPSPEKTGSPRLPTVETLEERRKKQILMGAGIGMLTAAIIFLLLLLLLSWSGRGAGDGLAGAGGQGSGEGTGIGDGTGPGSGSGSGGGSGAGSAGGSGNASNASSDAKSSTASGNQNADTGSGAGDGGTSGEAGEAAGATTGSAAENEPEAPRLAFQKFKAQPAATSGGSSAGSGDGSFLSGGGGGGGSDGREFLGVKVRGKIALVCDISGSMRADFPILVRQLREQYPKDTPLILVPGCYFAAPSGEQPQKLVGQMPYMGNEFANDPHAYTCNNTTDAILYAATELKRDTVMFNCDLQDSGSESAVAAFEELRKKKKKFMLSGRSLECEAPERLRTFIKVTGGGFKVDPIYRSVSPARPWTP